MEILAFSEKSTSFKNVLISATNFSNLSDDEKMAAALQTVMDFCAASDAGIYDDLPEDAMLPIAAGVSIALSNILNL